MPAAVAKNKFASVLEEVIQGREVIITKHNTPKAVVISMEKFQSLSAAAAPNLDALTADFNSRLAQMQSASGRAAMRRAFGASADALARAAVKAAKTRS